MSRLLDFVYDVQLSFSVPVRRHAFVLRCLPDDGPGQRVLDLSLTVDPVTPLTIQRDGFGNRLQIGRLEDFHDHFRYTVRGTVLRDDACRAAQPCHPVFRLPSPYTQPDEAMKTFLAGLTLPEKPRARAWALAEAVHDRMHYVPGATGVATTAAQAFAKGEGVCQDFAHIYLSLAHSLNALDTPTLVVEMGVGNRLTRAWGDQLIQGILSLMAFLGMWTGPVSQVRDPIVSSDGHVSFVNSPCPGILIPAVEHGTLVCRGQELGLVADPLTGEILQHLPSPADGLLFTLREYPVVYEGSLIARILGENTEKGEDEA